MTDGTVVILPHDERFPNLLDIVADEEGVFVAACTADSKAGAILSIQRRSPAALTAAATPAAAAR